MPTDEPPSTPPARRLIRAAGIVLGIALLAAPTAAHGTPSSTGVGLAFPVAVGASVGASLLGGGLVLVVAGRRPVRAVVPLLLLVLGGLSATLALDGGPFAVLAVGVGATLVATTRGNTLTDCGACADATLGAVTLHRGLEGVVLATVYAADATLGLIGAAVFAIHAAAETAAVGTLYADVNRPWTLAAVLLVQVGFLVGVAAGWRVVGSVPPVAEAGVLGFVGGVLLAVGAKEAYRRHTVSVPTPA